MAYGLHWEWRGFGELGDDIRSRIVELKPLRPFPTKVVDRYLWFPGCRVNVKLRSFRGAETLKFKRMIEVDCKSGLQLWMEKAEEDYVFPLSPKPIEELSHLLGVKLTVASISGCDEFVDVLRATTAKTSIVAVEKTRRSYVLRSEDHAVLVDLGSISAPQVTSTVGLEDLARLTAYSARDKVVRARAAVATALSVLGLPGELEPASYLEVLQKWKGKKGAAGD
jgi:hypothetical protein